ncbi:hypothetical protein G7Y89_g3766 [Cudoniella acicularis]|uniref:Uncharacterized protein n=1 Tax=Cudoniella acicularis TaxID=354080 RepID=A0A8H4RTR0_9HELO|nr:hypothetical protein G7Y89_g3766 [Cudoniella acicularis]
MNHNSFLTACALPVVPKPLSWSSIKSATDYNLVQYFESIASKSLTTVKEGAPDLRDVLIRIALSNGAPLSTAVLQSLLAFSSLHRHGLQSHAARLKLSAISALAASARTGVGVHQVISHVATLMLLCCFEIQQASEASTQWLFYISGVKNVLRAAHLGPVQNTSDMAALLYWVSYHDVLAKFSLYYWRHRHPLQNTLHDDFAIQVPQISFGELVKVCLKPILSRYNFAHIQYQVPKYRFPCMGMVKLMSDVFNMVLEPLEARPHGLDHQNLLTILEWKIRQDPALEGPKAQSACQELPGHDLTLETFQLSLLVYVERLVDRTPGQSAKMRSIIEKAMAVFSQLESLDRQFPLLILGCEARSDRHRMVVLDLIARTENRGGVRSPQGIKSLIQSLWAQDDLSEQEIPYMDKIHAVLSSSAILPALV